MAEYIPLRCIIPGSVATPRPPVNPAGETETQTIYPARFAKEPNSLADDEEFLGDNIGVNREQLRLPINPNYTIAPNWYVQLTGETHWSKVVLVRELFIAGRARYWIITRIS